MERSTVVVMPLGMVYITSCLSGNGNGHAYIAEKGSRRSGSHNLCGQLLAL